ncbi:MAG TPA: PASTA domain-containing protein [Solirubrobacteraceae bacterium]|nr:PASTA domain-containing protein [Solirubrobacteraceae bacterium]
MSGLTQDTVVDGRYKLVSRIGSGGMADVWCAEDLQLGRQVALKLLHRRFAEDPDFVERFRREASSAAGLQHPHVVSVYDRGEWEGTYYIAMELLQGETLKELIVREAPLDADRAIGLTTQILRAARFAHKRGIVHRDLKPHNVIVDPEGRAKVTDFGIARAGASDMTETGSIMGTAQYLSPEQAQGLAVSGQSDLYAIGIILYEMLTGSVPFDGDTAVTIALKQVSEPPVPPSHLNPAVPPALEAVVGRALEKEPAARFADADEFIAALEAVRDGSAVVDGSPTSAFAPVAVEGELAPLTEPEPERRWWLWATLGAVLLAGVVLAAILLTRAETRAVADVTGADVASAARRLRNDGFKPVVERVRNESPRDEVIGQDPQPGAKLEVGADVTLTVSDGPGTKAIPDVEGRTRAQARKTLRAAGFRVLERRAPSDDVPEGRVIRTVPVVGQEVAVGAPVTLVISSGPEQVQVPDLTGQEVADARETLEAAGLTAEVTREESEDEEPGTVLRQTPRAGSTVDAGSAVALVVAEEPEQVEVPDVTGRDATEASSALAAAGLEANVEEVDVDRPSQDGVVQRQNPRPGTRLDRGRRVTITVGSFEPDLDPDPGTETAPDETETVPEETETTPGTSTGASDPSSGGEPDTAGARR